MITKNKHTTKKLNEAIHKYMCGEMSIYIFIEKIYKLGFLDGFQIGHREGFLFARGELD